MKSLRTALLVAALAITLLASGISYAGGSSRGGGHSGGYSRGGGHSGGYYRGGGHSGGYYHGGGHYGGHYYGGVDVFLGGPFWGPSWYYPTPYYSPYYYPYYYPYDYPPAISVPSSPPVYIEREQPKDQYVPQDVWFYCPDSKAYYPYVKECPGGWQMVPAQPPSEQRR